MKKPGAFLFPSPRLLLSERRKEELLHFACKEKPVWLDYSLKVMEKGKRNLKRSGEHSRRNDEVCVIFSEIGPV